MRLGIATDLHLTPTPRTGAWNEVVHYDRALQRLDLALRWFGEREVDAVLILGDLTEEGDAGSLDRVLAALADGTPAPAYVLGGNHDGPLLDALRGAVRAPVAVLDRVVGDGVEVLGRHAVQEGEWAFSLPLGDLPNGDELLVLATHFPVVSRQEAVLARDLNYAGDLTNAAQTAQTLRARRGPTVVLCGHLHVDDTYADGTLLQAVTPPVVEGEGTAAVIDLVAGPPPALRRELRGLDGDRTSVTSWTYDGAAWSA